MMVPEGAGRDPGSPRKALLPGEELLRTLAWTVATLDGLLAGLTLAKFTRIDRATTALDAVRDVLDREKATLQTTANGRHGR